MDSFDDLMNMGIHAYALHQHDDHIRSKLDRPQMIYFGSQDDTLYGIELEIEFINADQIKSCIDEIIKMEFGNMCYFTNDETLNEYGIEIVTFPMTLETQLIFWDAVLKILKKNGARISERTGTHIHITKSVNPECNENMLEYIYDIKNREILHTIANRHETTYCSYDISDKKGGVAYITNLGTIEIRIFNATLDYDIMCSYIMFVKSLVDKFYCS
jgi:hypothetical protein